MSTLVTEVDNGCCPNPLNGSEVLYREYVSAALVRVQEPQRRPSPTSSTIFTSLTSPTKLKPHKHSGPTMRLISPGQPCGQGPVPTSECSPVDPDFGPELPIRISDRNPSRKHKNPLDPPGPELTGPDLPDPNSRGAISPGLGPSSDSRSRRGGRAGGVATKEQPESSAHAS